MHQMQGEDAQEGSLNSASHLGCVSAHVEVAPFLQQLPDQPLSLNHAILDVHLVLLKPTNDASLPRNKRTL